MIPAPDLPIGPVNTHFVKPGDELHRIHADIFREAEFNPCKGNATRFAPIFNKTGNCVPTIYAASTLASVCFETIFHNVSFKKTNRRIPIQDVQDKCYSIITPTRPIQCAQLFDPDLALLGLNRNKLIASPPAFYAKTAAWAKAVHDQYEDVEGLVWTSRQCDPNLCYLFFGDRVVESCFQISSHAVPIIHNAALLGQVRYLGMMRKGILITSNRK